MSRRKIISGTCHLCGVKGPLSFEHVPPEAAFNSSRVLKADIDQLLTSQRLLGPEETKGQYQQRGAGEYTLCRECNNSTGSWYAKEYVKFVRTIYHLSYTVPNEKACCFAAMFKPLKFLKQVAVMFCSVCPPTVAQKTLGSSGLYLIQKA